MTFKTQDLRECTSNMTKQVLQNEQMVITIINEYLEKNRYFGAHEIIPFISSRFAKSGININENGIRLILKSLIERNYIVEGSKLTREDILLNSNRARIYECIMKNPGIHFNKLVMELKLTIPVVEWHLNILIKFNYISMEKIDNLDTYFHHEIPPMDKKIIHLITKEKSKIIIGYLERNREGVTKNQLVENLKMHFNTVSKYLDDLQNFNIISHKSLSNMTLYFLNDDVYSEISQRFAY